MKRSIHALMTAFAAAIVAAVLALSSWADATIYRDCFEIIRLFTMWQNSVAKAARGGETPRQRIRIPRLRNFFRDASPFPVPRSPFPKTQ